jgi:hypothetical protein
MAAYMRLPRTTVIRRLDQLQRWGLIDRQSRRYYNTRKRSIPLSVCEATDKSGAF